MKTALFLFIAAVLLLSASAPLFVFAQNTPSATDAPMPEDSAQDSADAASGRNPSEGSDFTGMVRSIIFTALLFAAFIIFVIFSRKKK